MINLVRVRRQNNSRRRYAHVAPFLGKLSPVDHIQLDAAVSAAATALLPLPEPTLVVGLAESSLILAWQFVQHLQTSAVEFCFTTREAVRHPDAWSFQEPHSHGPVHWLRRPERHHYHKVVIVEDEITTGITLTNLILGLRRYARDFVVLTLADLREAERHRWMEEACAAYDLSLVVTTFSYASSTGGRLPAGSRHIDAVSYPNPHARNRHTFAQALDRLRLLWQNRGPSMLYMIGECVDVPMAFCSSQPLSQRPAMRHVTRSPWHVDGVIIHSQHVFGDDQRGDHYYLYNWQRQPSGHAVVVTDWATRQVAAKVCHLIEQHDIDATVVEVDQ